MAIKNCWFLKPTTKAFDSLKHVEKLFSSKLYGVKENDKVVILKHLNLRSATVSNAYQIVYEFFMRGY